MNKFVERHKLSKLIHEETYSLHSPISNLKETTVRHHLTPTGMGISKKTHNK